MSDYEGDWEPITARGGHIYVPAGPLPVPPSPANNYIVPKGRSFEEAEQAQRERKEKSRKSSAITLPRDYRRALQAFKPAIGLGKTTSHDTSTDTAPEQIRKAVQGLSVFQRYKANIDTPDETYHFTRSIKNLTACLPKQQNQEPIDIFKDRVGAICIDTDTLIVPSQTNGYACNIWGEPGHIVRAQASLYAMEMQIINPGKNIPKSEAFEKIPAYDGRIANRAMTHVWNERQRQYFQQETDYAAMPYQAHLYWPEGYDLDNFIIDYDDSVLQDLMNKYACIIRQEYTERVTRISCDTQQVLFQVHNRVMGLVREMVAKQRAGLYATHCEVPGLATYKDRIKLVKTVLVDESINIPRLTGKSLPQSEREQWAQLSSDINKKYKRATKNALRSCINSLHVSRKHLRLRVIFGDFGLVQVLKADNGQSTYQIDDFLTKIQRTGTKLVQRPLEEGLSFKLIDNIELCEEFTAPDVSWEVSFSFSGGLNTILQLVKEYIPNVVDLSEPSTVSTRWLRFSNAAVGDISDLISVNHIDLERVGYQLYLGGGTFFENQRALQDLRGFENNIRFTPSLSGLRHDGAKHVIYPYGNQELTSMRETTIAKYQFKETRGTFEIRRTDHFNAKPGQSSASAHRTEWSATYYYAGWDNLLSDFANNDPGQDVEWKRDLLTFFPKIYDPDSPQVLPHGFKHFMKEVDEIQTIISTAIEYGKEANTNGNHK